MRAALLALCLAAAACATATSTVSTLAAADAATTLIAGANVTLERTARPGRDDPLVELKLTLADGRVLLFEEANHTPHDVSAQAAGGPLAQVMGLDETAAPTLYRARDVTGAGGLCAPNGPALLGVHRGADGLTAIVGLKEDFAFEARADGSYEALPVGPAIVCARMRFR